jgi:anti-anti-sigma factor
MRWTQIEERCVDDVVILDLCAPQVMQINRERLLVERVRQLVSNSRTRIVLNLRDLRYVDDDGLGQIVDACKAALEADGSVKLCGLTPQLREFLRATRLDSLLEGFDSEQEAVRSFGTRF